MIEYLSYERCKANNKSRYFKLFRDQDGFYMEIGAGYRGMYIVGKNQLYQCQSDSIEPITELISELIEPLKIYTWPKTFPTDYVPGNHIMGSDEDSWSLEYKETEKKTTKHIRGRGSFPDADPYRKFYDFLCNVIPDEEFADWFVEG